MPNENNYVQLTDGHTKVTAIERESLKNISPLTPPGTKLLITTGKVVLGKLLLDNSNCKFLGGRVQQLMESWQANLNAQRFRFSVSGGKNKTHSLSVGVALPPQFELDLEESRPLSGAVQKLSLREEKKSLNEGPQVSAGKPGSSNGSVEKIVTSVESREQQRGGRGRGRGPGDRGRGKGQTPRGPAGEERAANNIELQHPTSESGRGGEGGRGRRGARGRGRGRGSAASHDRNNNSLPSPPPSAQLEETKSGGSLLDSFFTPLPGKVDLLDNSKPRANVKNDGRRPCGLISSSWTCSACTFLNNSHLDYCEMCATKK